MNEACPLCGTTSTRTILEGSDRLFGTTTKAFLVVECSSCQLLRLSPTPTPGELASYYPATYWYNPAQSAGDRLAERWRGLVLHDHVRFARRALASAPESGWVLDIGCGGGLFLKALGLPRQRILGLDLSPDAAHVAWHHNGVPTIAADLMECPLQPRCCSLVTMYHVLEHVYDPVAYLSRARDLLLEGGRLIVQVPNAASWQFVFFGEHWNGLDIPRHLVNFKEKDLLTLLDRCGFSVARVKHFSWRDNPAGFATSLAPALDPMGRRSRLPHERPSLRTLKDLAYFGLVLFAIPFAALEAVCGAGSSIMVEAVPA